MPTFRIAGHTVELERKEVERKLADVLPDPVREHYVVVGARRFPPKQILSHLTGLDRADFTTHQARRILKRLGFTAARAEPKPDPVEEFHGLPYGGRQAAALEPFIGRWVALGAPTEVLVAADTPQQVLSWLARHERRATGGMFRVPRTRAEAEFLGPP